MQVITQSSLAQATKEASSYALRSCTYNSCVQAGQCTLCADVSLVPLYAGVKQHEG